MKVKYLKLFLLIVIISLSAVNIHAQQTDYKLSMQIPNSHYFEVEMRIPEIKSSYLDLMMPVWIPGSYLVRDFPKNVDSFSAKDISGNKLKFGKINKSTWRVYNGKSDNIIVTYRVYAFDNSIRTSYLDESHAFINGISVFMYSKGMKDRQCILTIIPDKKFEKISTGLPNIENEKWIFQAENYDQLVDSPIEIGNQNIYEFKTAGVKHFISFYGNGNYNEVIDSLIEDIKKIVITETKIFRENPNKKYTFLINNSDKAGGGIEHSNSTVIKVNRWIYRPESNYKRFLSLIAHEYFHLWNVKRIRPKVLGPFDYQHPNYTTLLWVMEGVTSYYSGQTLLRAGLTNEYDYLNSVANNIEKYENRPGSKIQSAADASFDAWIKAYKPDENSFNSTISYYTKGLLLGMMLDLEIINNTSGEKSLDDLMRYLYEEYYKKQNRGFTDEEYINAAEKIAGEKLDDFFIKNVNGIDSIDFNKYLNYAGLQLIELSNSDTSAYLGINYSTKDDRVYVKRVPDGTPAFNSGIYAGDEIIAVGDFRVDKNNFEIIIKNYQPGDTEDILVSRNGVIKSLPVWFGSDQKKKYLISQIENPTQRQTMVYNKWLRK